MNKFIILHFLCLSKENGAKEKTLPRMNFFTTLKNRLQNFAIPPLAK